jgi:hypothetical protein
VSKKIFRSEYEAEETANRMIGWNDVEVQEVDLWEEEPAYVIRVGNNKYLRRNGYVE